MPNVIVERLKPKTLAGEFVLDTPGTAEVVRAARRELAVQQKAMASEMGISQSYLYDLEKGTRAWSMELFNRAKEALRRLTVK